MNRILFAAVAVSLLAACGAPTMPGQSEVAFGTASSALKTSSKTTTSSSISSVQTASTEGSSPVWQSTFVINSTYDIYFAVNLPKSFSGHSTINLQVFSPGSSPYVAYNVAFAAGVTAASGEQQAQVTSTGYRVWVAMPVAGTWIQQYNMTGAWSASAYLGGGATPTNVSFTLQ